MFLRSTLKQEKKMTLGYYHVKTNGAPLGFAPIAEIKYSGGGDVTATAKKCFSAYGTGYPGVDVHRGSQGHLALTPPSMPHLREPIFRRTFTPICHPRHQSYLAIF